jgi:tRNA (cmo5U34)-methyltransferase
MIEEPLKNNVFSFDTIENFDKHIDISIPDYNGLLKHILNISTYFIKRDSIIYDYGCSTGKLLSLLKKRNNVINTKFVGIDKSKNLIKEHDVDIEVIESDLIDFYPEKNNFSCSIFTLQFLSIENRKIILKRIYDSLFEGGCLLISEKTFIDNGFIQDIFSFTYYDFKLENFKELDILNKQFDLRYIMRPLTEEQNIKLFKEAGFTNIQSFWQSLQFKGWLLVK